MQKQKAVLFVSIFSITILISACLQNNPAGIETEAPVTQAPQTEEPVQKITPTATFTPTPEPTQEFSPPAKFGPQQKDFPVNINPLTGLPVANPDLLARPALLISITHFPVEVRPQGGLSFASWVFEYLIATGSTRFAAVFHGDMPYAEAPRTGNCEVRMDPFVEENLLLGNRVWQDSNADGIQSPGEQGIGGVCVNLLTADGILAQQTSTDTNGYYAFNVEAGEYYIEFVKPEDWAFTEKDVGYEDADSDASQDSGQTETFRLDADARHWDAGLIPSTQPDRAEIPPAEVGPVRSARLIHIHLQKSLQNSCLIYAGATEEIRDKIPGCAVVFKDGDGGYGSPLETSRMEAISDDNWRKVGGNFNYANNVFSTDTPKNGISASQVDLFYAQLNQSRWVYDASFQGWLRFVDKASEPVELHVDTDRLNGRQVFFENLVVLFVDHEVLAPLIIQMYLEQGDYGNALVFRDGQMFNAKWSLRSGSYEMSTGRRRPLAIQDMDGNPFPLRPGRTWFIVATPYSEYSETETGHWRFRIYSPPGAGLY